MADICSKSYNQVVEEGNKFVSCLRFYDPAKKVMVKRRKLSTENAEKCERESSVLEDCGKHENILDWFTFDKDDKFSYMSEERWSFTLETLVRYFRNINTTPLLCPKLLERYINTRMNLKEDIVPLMLKLMEHIAKGLNHLHDMGLFHRNLNPHNVVIVCGSKSMTAKIANFCTTERISIKEKSKVKTISHYSTSFQPPVQIKNNRLRQLNAVVETPETSEVDLFSFGY